MSSRQINKYSFVLKDRRRSCLLQCLADGVLIQTRGPGEMGCVWMSMRQAEELAAWLNDKAEEDAKRRKKK